jgi:uncharacterized protein
MRRHSDESPEARNARSEALRTRLGPCYRLRMKKRSLVVTIALAALTGVTGLAAIAVPLGCATSERPRERERKVRRYNGPVIDLFAHYVVTGTAEEAEEYRKNAADPRLARIVAAVTAAPGRPEETRVLNDRAIQLAAENGKVLPMPSVNPYDAGAIEELGRMADAGAVLLRLSLGAASLDPSDAKVAAVVQRAGERGVAVFIEGAGAADRGLFSRVITLAERHPSTQIVVVRSGLTAFRDAAALIQARKSPSWNDNVWLDLSSVATLYVGSPAAPELVWLIRKLQKRVLFGSGFPVDRSGAAIDAVQILGLEEGEQADVLYGNAARLLRLAG